MTYLSGIAPIVTVSGPGNLHHLSFSSNNGLQSIVGMMPIPATNKTNLLLGFSYTFLGYAFYWDGKSPAFWRLGNKAFCEPVGTSWTAATGVPWGNEIQLNTDVSASVAKAATFDGQVTVYFIPDDLD